MPIPQIVQPATGLAPGLNVAINDVSGPASYTTGGNFVSAGAFGLNSLMYAKAMDESSDGLNFVRTISPVGRSNRVKLQWFVVATGAEVANAVNLSTKTVRCMALGV